MKSPAVSWLGAMPMNQIEVSASRVRVQKPPEAVKSLMLA